MESLNGQRKDHVRAQERKRCHVKRARDMKNKIINEISKINLNSEAEKILLIAKNR